MRRAWTVLAVGIALCAIPANAAKYRGQRIDIYTGRPQGRWIIRTMARGTTLRTTIGCRPRRVCGDFKRLQLTLSPDSVRGYVGTFRVGGGLVRCSLEASVYPQGFEGVYSCENGQQGSISGHASGARRLSRAPICAMTR